MTLYVFTLLAGFFLLLACLPYIHKDIWSLCVVDLKTRWGIYSGGGVSLRDVCDPGLKAARDLELLLPATSFCPLLVVQWP